MYNQLRGSVRINASGRNLYKFINMIHSGHICCFKQYVRSEVFYADIYRHDLRKVQQFAEECGIELKHYEHETLSKKILRYRKRIGLVLGIILVSAATRYFSGIVLTIEIRGNSIVSDRVILAALEELDIKQGSFIDDINFGWCEKELRLMVDDISWAAIRHTGNRVVVEVTEIVEKPEMVQERMPCNVIADRAAQITSTSVYDGQLMRIVGDYVMPGDMLISGVIEDSKGHVTKHHAMGVITGIYEETAVFTEDFISESYLPTGEISDEKYLQLFNLRIPLFIGRNEFKHSNEEKNERQLSLFGKKLPISIVDKRITETEFSSAEYTEAELEERIMEKIYLYEKNFLSSEKILEREIIPEVTETSVTYTVKYTLEGQIGEQMEIFIK
ncbi:MAG: sporulation protein YqfD [Ruminococcus sp.]|nr:sporulation protein YqfD [Ruminococcus sp.]